MLNFKTTTITFIALIIVLSVLSYLTLTGFLFFLIIIALYLTSLAYGSYFINSQFYLSTVCSVKNKNKEISITFDDGPDREITPEILNILKEFSVSAAFFCIGSRIFGNETILKRINNEGHIIGNHSYSHSNFFDFFSSKKMRKEMIKTEDIINRTINRKVKYFRPPYGVTNPSLNKAVKKMNYTVVGWSLRSLDTKNKDYKKILSRVKRNLKSGDIILFHNINPEIKKVLQEFIKYAFSKNYKIVRLDKLLNIAAYENQN